MKPTVLKMLIFSCIFISATACKKDDPAPPAAKSKTTLLTQSAWKVQSVGLDANKDGVAEGDVTMLVPACKLDNSSLFKTDGTGVVDEATLKCITTDPQTQPFTWVFKNNETVLSGNFSFTNGDATILTLNETSLVVAYDDPTTMSHLIVTLKH